MVRKRSVSVIGDGGTITPKIAALAGAVGRGVVEAGFRLVTGGLGGVMEAAARGAAEVAGPGDVVAIIPGSDPDAAHEWASVVVPTGLGFYRNGLVAHSDAVVAIGGGAGTLSEMALAWKLDRLVIGLEHPDIDGWSVELAGRPLDRRNRGLGVPEDLVHPASNPGQVVDLLSQLIGYHLDTGSDGLRSMNSVPQSEESG